MKKSILFMLFCLIWASVSFTATQAKQELSGYSLDLSSIEDRYLKEQIQAMSIMRTENGWTLFVNNEEVSEGTDSEVVTFRFALTAQRPITVFFHPTEESVVFQYSYTQTEIFTAAFVFVMEDGEQVLYFYPDTNNLSQCTRRASSLSGGIYDFGTFTHVYQTNDTAKNVTYRTWINAESNMAYVDKNGDTQGYALSPSGIMQALFLETLVPSHPLAMNYMEKDLAKKSFLEAKTILYPSADIDRAVANEILTLTHQRTGLTYQTELRQFITFWRRISEENYDTTTTETIQTVCQWNEDVCSGVRTKYGDAGRLYAVFGTGYTYSSVEPYEDITLKEVTATLYRNISWPLADWQYVNVWPERQPYTAIRINQRTGQWSSYGSYTADNNTMQCNDNNDCEWTSQLYYRQKTASWAAWSGYSSSYPSDCNDSINCEWDSAGLYSKRTASWSGYGAYTTGYPSDCEDSADCTWASAVYYRSKTPSATGSYGSWQSSCSATDSYQCATYYKYTCKKGLLSNTKYSSSYYGTGVLGPCSSGYTVSARTSGYRYRYISWSAWSGYSTSKCTAVTGYRQCQQETRYAQNWRSWGAWSGYSYTSCATSSTVACRGPITHYRTRQKQWSSWSDYSYLSCTSGQLTECDSQRKYAYRYRSWTPWSGWTLTNEDVSDKNGKEILYQKNDGIESWDLTAGDSDVLGSGSYWTKELNEEFSGWREVTEVYAKETEKTVGLLAEMDEAMILETAEEIARASIAEAAYQQLKSINGKVLWDDLKQYEEEYALQNHALSNQNKNAFLNSKIFIPYIYVREHYRAVVRNMNVGGYDTRLTTLNELGNEVSGSARGKLLALYENINRDSRIIYFDWRDPLTHYAEVPANWKGYESLVEEIKQSDLKQYRIKVTLSEADLSAMQDYLDKEGYQKIGTCEMLRKFAYVFTDMEKELSDWLSQTESGCYLGNSD